jgi:hypothetical protein
MIPKLVFFLLNIWSSAMSDDSGSYYYELYDSFVHSYFSGYSEATITIDGSNGRLIFGSWMKMVTTRGKILEPPLPLRFIQAHLVTTAIASLPPFLCHQVARDTIGSPLPYFLNQAPQEMCTTHTLVMVNFLKSLKKRILFVSQSIRWFTSRMDPPFQSPTPVSVTKSWLPPPLAG